MNRLPLDRIGFGWRSHVSALRWLFLLYRRPSEFYDALKKLPRPHQVRAALVCFFQFVPWVLVCTVGAVLIFEVGITGLAPHIDMPDRGLEQYSAGFGLGFGVGIGLGFGVGLSIGLYLASRFGVTEGIVGWLGSGATAMIAGGIGFGVVGTVGIKFCVTAGLESRIVAGFAVAYLLLTVSAAGIGDGISAMLKTDSGLRNTADTITKSFSIWLFTVLGVSAGVGAGVVYGAGVGVVCGVAVGLAYWGARLRLYYLPVTGWMTWPYPRGRLYYWHPVAWDNMCSVPFPGLDRLLANYFEYRPDAARREVERLIDTYPSQQWRALKAKAAIVARDAGKLTDLTQLPNSLASLPEGSHGFLRQVPQLRDFVAPIAERQRQFDAATYPTVRKQLSELLVQQIENFRDQIAGFEEPLRTEFRAAAARWLDLVRGRFATALTDQTKITDQFFRAGDPVNREQEAFVSRTAIVAEVESQVLLATGCPGVILYGRRRMGKSTVLRNLTGFLPSSIPVGYVSMQNPLAFASLVGFCQTVGGAVRTAKRWDAAPPADPTDLPNLMRFLTWCDEHLGRNKERLILAIDEYEMLDAKIDAGAFSPDLLAALRESIQTHRNVTWVLAGSHAISELKHAEWSSYLVSARTVEVLPFTPTETRQLLTDPVRHSGLWRDASKRPRLPVEFWGADRIEQIHADAGGWPHLVQLLAEMAVDLVNAEGVTAVSDELYRRVRERVIVRGDAVLRQLVDGESTLPGEREYLTRFRRAESQPPPDDERVYRSLRRRLLVEEANGEWRMRVPLMLQWLRERG